MGDNGDQVMHESQVRNLIHGELQELEKVRQTIGCATPIGCGKGREMENFVNGTYQSDKNDIRAYIAKQDKINETGVKQHSEAMRMMAETLAQLGTLVSKISASEEKVKDVYKAVDKFDTRLWGIVAAVLLLCVGTIVGAWKLNDSVGAVNQVDVANQHRTEAIMTVLATNLSGKTPGQIKAEIEAEIEQRVKNDFAR